MTTFRLRRLNLSSFRVSTGLLKHPLLAFLLLYFITSSADLLNAYLVLFKVKLTNAISFALFVLFFISRSFQISKELFFLMLSLTSCMIFSIWNSPNLISSTGFLLFFLFNYLFYFSISYNQFRFYPPELVLKIYFLSFYINGVYTFIQILFSFANIQLPGVTQFIGTIARGTAFSYEPAYYALYMTPFTIYHTTKFILQEAHERKLRDILWPNLFLLSSTSTGCFFSYLFFLFSLITFKHLGYIKISVKTMIKKFTIICFSSFSLIWITNKQLINAGLLKFFYGTGISHFSVLDRWRGLTEYWNVFLEHPLIGVSFGGGPFYLAKKNGVDAIDLLDPQILAIYSPMNVTTEILASVGIMGSLFFLYFLYLLFQTFKMSVNISFLTKEEKISLIAFATSIAVMFMTLQFNQSIMRAYMWIHIGIFCGYAKYLKEKYKRSEKPIQLNG